MKSINKGNWSPADGLVLEDVALNVVKNNCNHLVVAGPGSGKSELLAQRACYLLQTGECLEPKRILAISFKKDAAINLKERVEKRCGKELITRFESMTYDAFAKSILDHFVDSLPIEKKPSLGYLITDASEENGSDKISFKTISNLAKEIIVTNPLIKKAIQLTYSHVFLDEFQDTTTIQYQIVKACFLNSNTVITAVGDGKQRIMLWAGAVKTIFSDFLADFNAGKSEMIMNHRSAPRLVAIQKAMYSYLNEKSIEVQSAPRWKENSGEAYLRFFATEDDEVEIISSEIKNLISDGVSPNQICILTKQTPDVYTSKLIGALAEDNIKSRNELKYQDVLSTELVRIIIILFKLSLKNRDPETWDFILNIFYKLNELDDDSSVDEFTNLSQELELLVSDLESLHINTLDKNQLKTLIKTAIHAIGVDKLIKIYPEYQDKIYRKKVLYDFWELLWIEVDACDNWMNALENFEGKNSIPIMTIHKSKGLEFEVVIFIGLEDSAFWSFSRQPLEDKCAFFVAVSRAKKRIDFTFCRGRSTRFNRTQSNNDIGELYQMLRASNVIDEIDLQLKL